MKSVLLSIKPKYCELIANGKKTVEVRKSKPKLEAPFKCYIYCTKEKDYTEIIWTGKNQIIGKFADKSNCKVIGEFVCDEIYAVLSHPTIFAGYPLFHQKTIELSCLTHNEVEKYSNGKDLCGWHISNLKIYDKPKGLYEFYRKCETIRCEGCEHLKYQRVNSAEYEYDCEYLQGKIPITRPPQSWCYVEEVKE